MKRIGWRWSGWGALGRGLGWAGVALLVGCSGSVQSSPSEAGPPEGDSGGDSGPTDASAGEPQDGARDAGIEAEAQVPVPPEYHVVGSYNLRFSQVQLDHSSGGSAFSDTSLSETLAFRLDIHEEGGSFAVAFGPEGKPVSALSAEVQGNQLLIGGHGVLSPVPCAYDLNEEWTHLALDLDAQGHLAGTGHAFGLAAAYRLNGSGQREGMNIPMSATVLLEPDRKAPEVAASIGKAPTAPVFPWHKVLFQVKEGIVPSSFASGVQLIQTAPSGAGLPVQVRWTEDLAQSQDAPWSGSRAWEGRFADWQEVLGQAVAVQSQGLQDLAGNRSALQSTVQTVANLGQAQPLFDFESSPIPFSWGEMGNAQGAELDYCEQGSCLLAKEGGIAGLLDAPPGSQIHIRYRLVVEDPSGPDPSWPGPPIGSMREKWSFLTLAASFAGAVPSLQSVPDEPQNSPSWAWVQSLAGHGFWATPWKDWVLDSPAYSASDRVGFSLEQGDAACVTSTQQMQFCGRDPSGCGPDGTVVVEKIEVVGP